MSTIKTNAIQTVAGKPILNSTGSILQVVQGETRTTVAASATGTLWSGVSITPGSASSKVLILANFAFGSSNLNGGLKILRNGSNFMTDLDNAYSGGASAYQGAFNTVDDDFGIAQSYSIGTYPVVYLDSPSSTSALTYSLYYYQGTAGSVYLNRQNTDNGGRAYSSMTLIEISG
jgi:hypothetical protein